MPPQGPHMPREAPVGMTHDDPGQQSALTVHRPHAATHCMGLQTNCGVPPATGLGTHGAPLQQSALDAQAPAAVTHCAGAHRGTPRLS